MDPDLHYSENLDPDPHIVKIQELQRPKMEPWRVANAHNVGVKAQNGALEGL